MTNMCELEVGILQNLGMGEVVRPPVIDSIRPKYRVMLRTLDLASGVEPKSVKGK